MLHKVEYGALNNSVIEAPVIEFEFAGRFASRDGGITSNLKYVPLGGEKVDHPRFLENFEHFLSTRQIFVDPDTGNNVSTYWANTDQLEANADNLTAIVTTWTSSMESNGGNRREFAVVAAMNPETPFVIVDNPGSGFSTKLPDDVMEHTADTGEFDQAAGIITRALGTENFYPRTFMGVSTGARYAIGAGCSRVADNLQRIGAIDPPGSSGYGRLRLALAMAVELGYHAPKFGKASRDPYLHPDVNFGTDPAWQTMVGPKELSDQLRQNASTAQKFLDLPKAMSNRQGLKRDIVAAMKHRRNPYMHYVLPLQSELRPEVQIREMGDFIVQAAQTRQDASFIERIRVLGIDNATHYFTSAYPQKVGSIVAQILNK